MISRVAVIWVLLEVLIAKSHLINIQFLTQIDIESYGCDHTKLIEAEEGFIQLNQTLQYIQNGQIGEHINELRELQVLVRRELEEQNFQTFVYLENFQYSYLLKQKSDILGRIKITEKLISHQFEDIRFLLNQIIKTLDKQERIKSCEILSNKIKTLLEQLVEIQGEHKNLIDINYEEVISKIQRIKNKCDNDLSNHFQQSKLEQTQLKDIFIEFPEQIQVEKTSSQRDVINNINLIDLKQEQTVSKSCVSGESSIVDMSSSQTSVLDLKVGDDKIRGANEYGYGYWIRWLTRWPQKQMKGISEPWYFISRLTKNDPYDNINMGDRILAIWLGQAGYTFVTNDITSKNPNLQITLPYEDIEGVWTYIHFSYKQGQAVGIMKIEDNTKIVVLDAMHEQPNFLRLIIGGSNLNQYPGFNGQISSPIFKIGAGSFVNTEDEFNKFVMACNHRPEPDCRDKNEIMQLSQGIKKYDSSQQEFYEHFDNQRKEFPTLYGIGGWYKWVEIVQEPEHLAFRITINDQETNKNLELGDRTLAVQLSEKQLYTFSTYSYQNMFGVGQSNIVKNIDHKNKHIQWHYISFQYNRETRQAYGSIIFKDDKLDLKFENVNHYLVPVFRIFIGKDKFYPAFNGYIADLNYVTCQDLYNSQFHPSYTPESANLLKFPIQIPELSSEYHCQISDETIFDSAYDDIQSIAKVEITENLIEGYGYSFWLRYLTRYPKPMYQGKTEPWYFVSRLTNNLKYQDTEKGDRLLGIWQGQGFYAFFTDDYKDTNQNLNEQIKYDDIEGVWTYFHFSYSSTINKAVGFVKYSDQEPQSVAFNADHQTIIYLKLIIGGSDLSKYPAINGQFTKATFKIGSAAFIDTTDQLNQYSLECNPQPQECCDQYLQQIFIQDTQKFQEQRDLLPEMQSNSLDKFPNEYSVFGWFKWEPTKMDQWHLAFRLHINKGETNKNDQILGDRTLAAWVSPSQDGIYAFSTYSYQGLNGNGEPNIVQIIPQDQQETKWHFIFFSYNRVTRIAEGYIKFQNKQESIHFDKINHFLVPQFYLNVGQDRFYKSWNGYIGKFTMNLCAEASKHKSDQGILIPNFIDYISPPTINPFPNFYVTETIETCLINTKVVEITQENLRSVINAIQEEETQEKVCFCSLMAD
ncbi:unnamed protein product (macronuclear) [Paramecium tetraurelia]|uniref:Uncharacterized protein n=1 Tax=Paramecium tetraurelia TaxID=5888 RepID=A0BLG6_PARTE|nr:uncharacterized protein GSPATT00030016001 [Paramecium tetraurelia]CAK59383.1 unnamed protein product [Paramecium tetraurelia]|eukprot:XP_001426781.1 hypothetical protein (macronuclear) [Paramecium tetraurelia strain d4-2]